MLLVCRHFMLLTIHSIISIFRRNIPTNFVKQAFYLYLMFEISSCLSYGIMYKYSSLFICDVFKRMIKLIDIFKDFTLLKSP